MSSFDENRLDKNRHKHPQFLIAHWLDLSAYPGNKKDGWSLIYTNQVIKSFLV